MSGTPVQFHRTVTKVGMGPAVYKALVTTPEDYVVTVSPEPLVFVRKYEKQSYNITLMNKGSWDWKPSFGQLIWAEEKGEHKVLELGIVVHSVIIGVSLGASESSSTIKPLIAALSFHHFFEGLGLGGCIFQAKFKYRTVIIMVLFFSLTTPSGIAIGIGISSIYDENSSTALLVQGFLLSASAGILIYMALVDLLAADFMNPKMLCNFRLQVGANFTLLLGASLMSVLARWGGS